MKRNVMVAVVLAVGLFCACAREATTSSADSTGNTPFSVKTDPLVCTISTPADGSRYTFGDIFNIHVDTRGGDHEVESVTFYLDDHKVFVDYTAPYELTRDTVKDIAGQLTIKAVARDTKGRTAVDTIRVSVKYSGVQHYTYQVIRSFDHDPGAFTQGLVYDRKTGYMYEGTGLTGGRSSLRKVDFETGRVLQFVSLAPQYFGEGVDICNNKIYQLTWQNNICFVYDKDSFLKNAQFTYTTEGWGLTHNDTTFIMSDGSSYLFFRDFDTFKVVKKVRVTENGSPVSRLNELEFIYNKVFANVWQADYIVIIDLTSGMVVGKINLRGLLNMTEQKDADVLNGIAYDEVLDKIYVTGKLWPKSFEIKPVALQK